MDFDRFSEIAQEETALLPDYVFDELTGGVLTDPSAYLHPGRLADDLFILGTYSSGGYMGKQIVLYYGSFAASMNMEDEESVRAQIRATLRHEFRHHMETRAGLFFKDTLIEEDKKSMMRYYMRHKKPIIGDGDF